MNHIFFRSISDGPASARARGVYIDLLINFTYSPLSHAAPAFPLARGALPLYICLFLRSHPMNIYIYRAPWTVPPGGERGMHFAELFREENSGVHMSRAHLHGWHAHAHTLHA